MGAGTPLEDHGPVTVTGLVDELGRVRELVEIESPSRDVAASERITAVLSDWFASAGGAVRTVSTQWGESLVVEVPGRGDPLLFVGHSDTVWDVGTLAGEVPWRVDGDRIAGAGAYDMKSGLVIMLAALERARAAHRAGGAQPRSVRVVVVCDEEIGSPTTQALLHEAAQGVRAVIGFESPHPDGALKVGRRGSTRVRLAVRGRAAHAALDPELGVSAIDELVDQLLAVRSLVADPALPGPVLCNIGTVAGGTRANVVPDAAEAEIGLRFVDGETERLVLEGLHALRPLREGAALSLEVLSSRPAWAPSPEDAAWLAEIAAVAEGLGQTVAGRPADGAGDTNLLGSLGLPTVDGMGPSGGGAHAVDEHFSLESFGRRIELLRALLLS